MSYYGGKFSGEAYSPETQQTTGELPPPTPIVAPVAAVPVSGTVMRAVLGPATGRGWYVRRITVQGDF